VSPEFLDGLRARLKEGTFRPLPVRERMIPKPGGSGKLRKLGIPAVADKVIQAALKLVLEPIFEAGFSPASYGFRPRRRAHDAIAEIHHFGTRGYRWVLDADIRRPAVGDGPCPPVHHPAVPESSLRNCIRRARNCRSPDHRGFGWPQDGDRGCRLTCMSCELIPSGA
jgi:hypothetical protein